MKYVMPVVWFAISMVEMIGMMVGVIILVAVFTGDARICLNNRCIIDIDRPDSIE